MRSLLRPILVAVLVLAASPALAHKLKVFASAIGNVAEGRVYFVGGGAALDVPVTLRNGRGEIVGMARTTAPDGRFAITLPYRDDFSLIADAQDGHVAQFALEAVRLPASLPDGPGGIASTAPAAPAVQQAESTEQAPGTADLVEAAVARQLAPMLDQIDGLADQIRLRDIVGGIGYILGLFGLWALFATRRKPPGTGR